MENAEQQNLELSEPVTELRVQLGERLQRERLSQQKEIVDVARRLMLSKVQLLAVEAGQSENFHHERRYLQAIKSYVFYLNLENNPSVANLLSQIERISTAGLSASPAAAVAQLHGIAAPARDRAYTSRRPKFVYYGLGLLVAGALALAISEGWPFDDEKEYAENSSSTEQVTLPAAVSNSGSEIVQSRVVTPVDTKSESVSPPVSAASTPAPTSSEAVMPRAEPLVPPAPVVASPIVVAGQVATPVAPEIQSPRGTPRMRIEFTADCWVLLQTSDGKREERIYKQGQHLEVPVASVMALVLGNAPAAKLSLQGRSIDIVKSTFTQGNVTRLDQTSLQSLQKN